MKILFTKFTNYQQILQIGKSIKFCSLTVFTIGIFTKSSQGTVKALFG